MKNRFLTAFFLLLFAGFGRAQNSMSVLPGSGTGFLNDTVLMGDSVGFTAVFQYFGNTTYTGSVGFEIYVDTTGTGTFALADVDSLFIQNITMAPNDTVTLVVSTMIVDPPYKLGGNTTVIWPIAGVGTVDSISGVVFVADPNNISEFAPTAPRQLFRPYPNPTKNTINIGQPGATKPRELLLYDSNGRLMQKLFNISEMSLDDLENGVYILWVIDRLGYREQHLIVKQE